MNSHKNARLGFEGRKLLIERFAVMGLIPAAEVAGISQRTACKWRKRFAMLEHEGLIDRSSRPTRTRTTVDAELAQRIERLRRKRMPIWATSQERTAWLPAFLVYYNARRPHSALGYKSPASRLGGNNLLQLDT